MHIAQMWAFIGNVAATGEVNSGPFATALPWPLECARQTNLVVANAGFSLIGELDEAACDSFWYRIYILRARRIRTDGARIRVSARRGARCARESPAAYEPQLRKKTPGSFLLSSIDSRYFRSPSR